MDETAALSADDILDDSALTDVDGDRFEHRAVARTVGDLVCASNPPVNVALYGPWGSGKSSFYALMKDRIKAKNPGYRVVPYNAWKYGGESLKRNFITSVARELGLDDQDYSAHLTQDRESNEFRLGAWVKENRGSLGLGLVLALVAAATWLLAMTLATWAAQDKHDFSDAVLASLPGAGTVLSIAFAALLLGPKALESANIKVSESAPASDDQFVRTFSRLVEKATSKGKTRLVVFIDELDRCAPGDVVTTLKDLKTFLDESHCIFVVAADREVLERALRSVEQATPIRSDEPYYSTPGAFLDKIFQHQVALPPLRGAALTRFARGLVVEKGGLWADLRDADEGTARLDRVVYTLIPAHVRSPRRVKVLLNNFATNVRVAEARGFDWIERSVEIAYLTVLQTEFPAVAADLLTYPRLLAHLLDSPANPDPDLSRVLNHYSVPVTVEPGVDADAAEDSPAGEILGDDADKSEKAQARARLCEELRGFLRKNAAAGIQTPRSDLLYLQSAGAQEGLSVPRLGEVIDYASDTAPEDVAAAFEGKPSEDLVIATTLLATKSDTEYGPGRSNLVEAACLLVERMGSADVEAVQARVAPSVLAEVATGALRPNAVPGAMILAAVAASDELMEQLTDTLDLTALARNGVLDRLSGVLRFAGDAQSARVSDMLGSVYPAAPGPLHTALRDLPAAEAKSLWERQKSTVTATLKKLRADYSEAVKAAPGTAAARRSAAEAEAAADPESLERAHSRFEDLLQSVRSKNDVDASLLSDVLLCGQQVGGAPIHAVVREQAPEVLELLDDIDAVNRHAVWALDGGALSDVEWWTEKLDSDGKKYAISVWAANRLIRAIQACDQGRIEPIEQAVVALGPLLIETEKSPSLVDAMKETLVSLTWPDDSAGSQRRRVALYRAAEALRHLDGEAFDEVLLDDLELGLAGPLSETDTEFYLGLLSGLSASVSAALDEKIAEAGEDSVLKMRARIALRRRADVHPVRGGLIRSVIENVGANREVVDEWLSSKPDPGEVDGVLAVQGPSAQALRAYASTLSAEDRSALWLSMLQRGAPAGQLGLVGRDGVTADVVSVMTPRILNGPTQESRQEEVARLKTATVLDTEARRAAADLIEQLLAGRAGDASLAGELAVHIDGMPHGYVTRTKEAFNKVVSDNPRRIPQETQRQLIRLRLLSASKKEKKGLRGMLGLP